VAKTSRREAEAVRRERAAQIQRAHQQRERRRTMLGIVFVLLILAFIGFGVYHGLHKQKLSADSRQIMPAAVTGQTTVQPKPDTVPNTTGIAGVVAYDTAGYPGPGTAGPGTLGHDHVAGPVKYAVTPPVGGPHNAIWMNAGVYTKPVSPERAVHNLEHGAVWITYDPDLPSAQVQQLVDFFTKQSMIPESADHGRSNRFVDLSPWTANTLPSPIMISSWGYQLGVDSPTDPRLQQFVDKFRHSPTYSPEYGSAVDGIGVLTGGQPAVNGSSKPNPAGTTG
jgi:Protein of unknown function (DUF3105)